MTELTLDALRPRFAAQYLLDRELGRGGMGIVFLARELSLDRLVAIKLLPPALAQDPAIRERFLREARTAAQLSHPNIVPIYRADTADELVYFAMGYVDGETLAERLASRGPLPPAEAVRILRETAWALAYAHARGVVHRDVKPENIMLERGTGRVTVTDFGIARDVRASALTADGMVMGSVHYMSPEQVAGTEIDGRSDLYALGVVAFQLLSGRLPFDAPQASAVLLMQATKAAPLLAEVAPTVPAGLALVVDRCLRKDPAERYVTGEALAEALTQALQQAQSGPSAAPDPILSENAAKAVWLRAAQLQADAAQRVQDRTAQAEAFATGVQPSAPTTGYRRLDVEAAAIEAGIGAEFVQLALAELPGERGAAGGALLAADDQGRERLATFIVGTSERSMQVTRTISGTPLRTLEAIGRIFPTHPWDLTFRDTVGGHPLDGGVLTFTVREITTGDYMGGGSGLSTLRYYLSVIDAYQLRVTLHPLATDPRRCEVTMTADLRSGVKKNAKIGFGLGVGLGGGGATIGMVVAAAKGALLLAAPLGLGIFAVMGGLMVGTYRWSFRWGLTRARRELEHLLDALQASLRSQDVFGAPATLPSPPQRGPDDDTIVLLSS
ncbi:MAG: serine/threonine protein kinase [Gemmatimonadetes bacterium]|nr:serine/threonine protein kinase [Gemmatimonadota bacterium]MBL0180123.1 serine/threonine protein kinase [Gemmatimonadota bacterium]